MKKIRFIAASAASVSLLLASCGVNPGDFKKRESTDGCKDKVIPPKGYYDALMAEKVNKLGLAATSTSKTLYVNFDGATVQKGFQRGQSFILCANTANIPAPGYSDTERQEIVDRVTKHYDDAGVEITVTATKPVSGDYTVIHVGGSYGTLGCTESPSTLGIAPFDDGNQNLNDVGFAFTDFEADIGVVADTIAHEAGHTFGLDHTINAKDIMYPSARGNDLAFAISQIVNSTEMQDGPAVLRRNVGAKPGYADPNAAGDASNGGSNNGSMPAPGNGGSGGSGGSGGVNGAGAGGLFSGIMTLGGLLNQVQPNQILNVAALLPGFASMIPGMSNGTTANFPAGNYGAVFAALPGIDKVNTLVSMAAPGLAGAAGAAGFNPASIASMAALAAFGGYANVPAAMTGAQTFLTPLLNTILQMLGMNLAGQGQLPDPSHVAGQLPSYVNAYKLGSMTSVPALMSAMNAQSTFINSNYAGTNQAALLSGLKVAASQAYVLMNNH